LTACVDLSKILGGQTQILGGNVVKIDKCMGVSRLLGARARSAPLKSTPTSMTHGRLSQIVALSMERDFLRQLDFDKFKLIDDYFGQ